MGKNNVNSVPMTDEVRDAILYSLYVSGDKQTELAEEVGKSRQYVNGALQGRVADMPDIWQKMLKARGLKVVAIPEDTEIDYHSLIRAKVQGKGSSHE